MLAECVCYPKFGTLGRYASRLRRESRTPHDKWSYISFTMSTCTRAFHPIAASTEDGTGVQAAANRSGPHHTRWLCPVKDGECAVEMGAALLNAFPIFLCDSADSTDRLPE